MFTIASGVLISETKGISNIRREILMKTKEKLKSVKHNMGEILTSNIIVTKDIIHHELKMMCSTSVCLKIYSTIPNFNLIISLLWGFQANH